MPARHWKAIAAAGLLALAAGAPAPVAPRAAAPLQVTPVLSTAETILGQPIAYPEGAPAHVTAEIITMPPGSSTGWHRHEVPLFGYMLEGELTVEYRGHGKRVYRAGDALTEAFETIHDGTNTGTGPVRILAVFMGADGVPDSVKAD